MAYWWVFQNQTFEEERSGGYLWAPLVDKGGGKPHHWETMSELLVGDTIFSYVGQTIKAVSIVVMRAHDSPQPREFNKGDTWNEAGRKADLDYMSLPKPMGLGGIAQQLTTLLPEIRSPLNTKGTGNQGYLYRLPPEAGRFLTSEIESFAGQGFWDSLTEKISTSPTTETERLSIARSRIGQGEFRDSLLKEWNQRCCVSGLDVIEMLRASHIKPWRDCNNEERLDPDNGLLLGPQFDAAFDKGLVTFGANGHIMLTPSITTARLARAGISGGETVMHLTEARQHYLDYHRRIVFRS